MKALPNDWDQAESEALRPLEDELRLLRERHADDPPLDILRAASAGELPAELQASTAAHLAESRWSRLLVEGADAGSGGLDPDDEARLFDRIERDKPSRSRLRVLRPRVWASLLAAAAAVVVAVAIAQRSRETAVAPATGVAADVPRTAVPPPAAPQFLLALDQPPVKISPRAVTYRGDVTTEDFLSQLKPALDAYRQADYQGADREFTMLATRYPQSVEVFFYQGVARLFLNDFTGADASLSAADRLVDASFAADVSWYRAVVDERLGRLADARSRLKALCEQGNHARQAAACDAALKLR